MQYISKALGGSKMKFDQLVNQYYDNLNENDLHILNYITNNKKIASSLSINDLAKRCNISKSSLLRFTRKLGFSGYSEFRYYVKWEIESRKGDVNERQITQVLIQDIETTIKNINIDQIDMICKVLYTAGRIFLYGTGYSQMNVARELQKVFMAINEYLYILYDNEQMESIMEDLNSEDVVIIISLSGNSKILVPIMKQLNAKNITVISITRLKSNYLSSMATHNLYVTVSSVPTPIGKDITSFIPFYIIGEVLCSQYLTYKLVQKKDG
jgi:RpiR family transcriptional regulator, glv operon transcriptional regulator